MPNIHTPPPVHVPGFKPPRKGKAEQAAELFGRKTKGIRSKVETKIHNRTSSAGQRADGGKFGVKREMTWDEKDVRSEGRMRSALAGGITGAVAGGVVGSSLYGTQSSRDARTLQSYHNKKAKVHKADKVHLITDVGTAAGKAAKAQDKRWPYFRPVTFGAAAAGAGGLSVANYKLGNKMNRKRLDAAYKAQKKTVSKARLQRYTPTKEERRKMRAEDAAIAGGTTAALTGVWTGLTHHHLKEAGLPTLKAKTNAKIIGGATVGAAGLAAASKYHKQQYRIKKSREHEREQWRKNRKRTEATMGGVIGAQTVATGNVMRRMYQGNKAHNEHVMNTATGRYGKLEEYMRGAEKVKAANKRSIKASLATVGVAAAGIGTMGATANYNKKKMAQAKAKDTLAKSATVSAFGVDHG